MPPQRRTTDRRGASGFTLFELLVVMGIITILIGLVAAGLGGSDSARAVMAGEEVVAEALHSARLKAAALQRPTRVLVLDEPGEGDGYLRKVLSAQQQDDGTWKTIGNALDLPVPCYFDLASSTPSGGLPAPSSGLVDLSPWGPRNYHYIEFDATGRCLQAGGQFVITRGIASPGGGTTTVTFPAGAVTRGVALHAEGGESRFVDQNHLLP